MRSAPLVNVFPVVGASVPSLIRMSQRTSWDHETTDVNNSWSSSNSLKTPEPWAAAYPRAMSAARMLSNASHSARKYRSDCSSACMAVPSGSMIVPGFADSTSVLSLLVIREMAVVTVSRRSCKLPARSSTASSILLLVVGPRFLDVNQLRSLCPGVSASHGSMCPTWDTISLFNSAGPRTVATFDPSSSIPTLPAPLERVKDHRGAVASDLFQLAVAGNPDDLRCVMVGYASFAMRTRAMACCR